MKELCKSVPLCFQGMFGELSQRFQVNFISDHRWRYIVNGLKVTLVVAGCSVLVGIFIGFLLAMIRTTHDRSDSPNPVMRLLNGIAHIYITVIRGTPVVIQLLIIYYVVFQAVDIDKILVAIMAFGMNSGAYVAEIFRSGILSVDTGQLEAGRSLGFSYGKTMWLIIMPQALKNVLPTLGNEFIVLLKETSVCGYIALTDLTKGADIIRSRTYDAFLPLFAVALIYLLLVLILTKLVGKLERRLQNRDH